MPPNPLRADPTRTASLRRAFLTVLRLRFSKLATAIRALVVGADVFGLKQRTPLVLHAASPSEQQWVFSTSAEQLKKFKEWLEAQIEEGLLANPDGSDPFQAFIEQAFQKGAGRSFDDVKSKQREGSEPSEFYAGTKDQFLKSSFGRPVAKEKVELLVSRNLNELSGVTDTMATQMTRSLADGLAKGSGAAEIARDLVDRLDLARGRAETIARTEIVRAHAEGQLVALEQMGVDQLGVNVEWSTAGDDRVCPICEDMEGQVYTIEEAQGRLPAHPNCRCAWVPANVGEEGPGKK